MNSEIFAIPKILYVVGAGRVRTRLLAPNRRPRKEKHEQKKIHIRPLGHSFITKTKNKPVQPKQKDCVYIDRFLPLKKRK